MTRVTTKGRFVAQAHLSCTGPAFAPKFGIQLPGFAETDLVSRFTIIEVVIPTEAQQKAGTQ